MKLMTAAQAAAKWASITPTRTEEYAAGVRNPKQAWAAATVAGALAYKTGVQEGIARNAFEKGVQAAGDSTYTNNTLAKGPQRFAEGVSLGQNAYATKIAPVLQTIENTVLPQRYGKGDPRNIQRVAVLAAALRKSRTG